MVDSITWRTTDLTRWGSGLGSPLSKTQVDINFWVLQTRLLALEDHAASAAVGISNFYINPSNPAQFFEVLTDSTQLGPFTLPQSTWNFTNPPTGAWTALVAYSVNDVFTRAQTLYVVKIAHTSAATFDPNATDGSGHDLYQVLFSLPTYGPAVVQAQSGTTWTPVLADAGTYNRFTHVGGCTMLLPLNASTAFSIGTEIHGRQTTASAVVISIHSGGTINKQDHCFEFTSGIGATFTVKKVATDEWDLFGRLEPGASP